MKKVRVCPRCTGRGYIVDYEYDLEKREWVSAILKDCPECQGKKLIEILSDAKAI